MLWWRGLRSRLGVDLILAALAALAVATAVLGPLLVRAVEQSSVADVVADAGARDTSLTVAALGDGAEDLGPLRSATEAALSLVVSGPTARLWEPLQQWTETTVNVGWQRADAGSGDESYSRLRVADGCHDLTLTAGSCPTKPGSVLVSTSDAALHRVGVGTDLAYRLPGVRAIQTFRVVGVYDPATATTPLTRPGQEAASTSVTTGDPLVLVPSPTKNLPLPSVVTARVVLRQPVVVADLPLLRTSVSELGQGVVAQDISLVVDAKLSDALDRVVEQTRAALVLVGVVEAQALGLALFAVVVVLARVARARAAEWGAGRLLGIPRARWYASVYLEPGVALAAGVPLGYAAALLVGHHAVRTSLRPHTPFEPWRWPVLTAAVVAGLVALVALVAVSLPSLRRPLAELVAERTEARRTTPLGAAAQSVVVLLAALTGYVLLAGDVLGGRGPQIGLLAPALFAVALAVLGVRLAVVLVRLRARRPARTLVGLVVARQAARTPSSLSPAVVVAVGVALLVFAGQVLVISVRNQESKADAVAGAATVLHLTVPRGADLVAAVDRADPGGRQAMAVRERATPGATGAERIVAVDTSRLAAVAAWSPRWAGVAEPAAALRPPTGAPVVLRGRRLDVRMDQVSVTPGGPDAGSGVDPDPRLVVTLDTGPRWRTVELGEILGRQRLTAAVPCQAGCRVVAVGLRSTVLVGYSASLHITGMGTDAEPPRGPATWLTQPDRWYPRVGAYYDPDPAAFALPEPDRDGLTVELTDTSGGRTAEIAPSDVVDPLPALLGPATQEQVFSGMDDTAYGTGLDGDPQLLHVVGRAQVLPRALADGVLVDLRSAGDLVDPQNDSSTAEVWLAPGAPGDVEAALVADGFVVTGRDQLSDVTARLLREPTTRGASVAQTLARSAALLTLLALVAARVADAPRRRLDWRSIADAGAGTRTLRRLAAVEIAVPALLGVLLGGVSGVVALALSAARLPVVDLSTPGPPLALGLNWPLALGTVAASAAAVLVVAVVGAVVETRRVAVS